MSTGTDNYNFIGTDALSLNNHWLLRDGKPTITDAFLCIIISLRSANIYLAG
jgi:hypothetical protein